MTRWRIPDQAELSAIQAKAKSRKVTFGTGALQDDLQRAKARNAKRRALVRKTARSAHKRLSAAGYPPGAPEAQERGKTPGKPRLREAQVLRACMDILRAHPKVAICWRQNTAAMKIDTRYLRFSFVGASDLMGVMDGGKFLAVEVKSTGKQATDDQAAFLVKVSMAGGYALCVDDPAYLAAWLADLLDP